MSDNETHNSTNTDNTGNQPKKGRQPDYDLTLVMGENTPHQTFYDIGALWKSSQSDNLVGSSIYGKVIARPRQPKEVLQEMRTQAPEAEASTPQPEIKP